MAGSVVDLRVLVLVVTLFMRSVSGLGVNWGTISVNPMPANIVVKMLQANGITKVKLFDADVDALKSLAGTNIEVMVAAPNEMLVKLAADDANDEKSLQAEKNVGAAHAWVNQNVTGRISANIKWVAVGNEPFLAGYNGSYVNVTLPALRNMVAALAKAGLGDTVKAVVPFNADVLDGAPLPSATRFKPEYMDQILPMLQIFNATGAPFIVNLYPFISKYQDVDFPLDYAFFTGTKAPLIDGARTYTNALDASLDALISALGAAGFPNMPVVVGEIGWPSDGNQFATVELAGRYNQELIQHLQSNVGTPLRPNTFFEFYLFGLLDENAKSILPGAFERHWGLFYYDGVAKYPLDLAAGTNAPPQLIKNVVSPPYMTAQYCVLKTTADRTNLSQNMDYACSRSDCTPLAPGSSCAGLTVEQTASYAFNTYFQIQNQDPGACNFQGLAQTTTVDPSVGTCRFRIGLVKHIPSTIAASQLNYEPNSAGCSRRLGGYSAVIAFVITFVALLLNTDLFPLG